jgi:hypothetical protein
MSAQQKNDARGTARLLALAARDSIRNPRDVPATRELLLNNVYRLLEEYRVTAFFGSESSLRPYSVRATEAISLLPRAERHVKDVRAAMESAQATAFPGQPKDQAIEAVVRVLRGITYPERFGSPSDEDLARASTFFDEVVSCLNAG